MLQTDALEHTESGEDDASALSRELFFQRCRWCGSPAFRRSFCRACGSTAFTRERSEGSGVVVRRHGHVPHNTWFVAMDEGFYVLCQVTGTAPVAVAVGARVTVVRSVAPPGGGMPVVELTYRAESSGRWW
ncbi:zinc ribbon domain-containing protein [Streptomyces sp. ME02-8801-2C]|uniref:Zn-ribbon domain-containing OB-fold protein n=1 Tax=Streptomyces sp. ME02-8801-2C TaxID=3028680 RepID=UPI0029B0C6EE|nr:zinc ribbon domain-containing protein [Streptomyces sp. ME02-8801-2C]MDX3451198.1 zinc ribbon domain-containing protein [Streptomyces sp. ME02-8801-2C]